jgi:hypothetical protein
VAANAIGGDITLASGNGGAITRGGDINFLSGNGGSSAGRPGDIFMNCGTPSANDGGNCGMTASAGVGLNKSGGSLFLTTGDKTGAGAAGLLFITNTAGTYGVATGAGVVTRGNVGPGIALTLSRWLPVTVDGTLRYIELYS